MSRFKPKDPAWNFYDVVEEGSKKIVTCKDCKKVVSGKSDRLRAHTPKCPGPIDVPKTVPDLHVDSDKEPVLGTPSRKRHISDTSTGADQDLQPGSPATPSTPKRPRIRQRNLSGFGIVTDSLTRERLDAQIAKLFYACNLPFNIADNPVWKETIEMLRPGYSSPNRKDIGGYLLDNMHEQLITKMKTELEGKDVVLMQVGWSDVHNTPVVATSIHTEEKSYFLSAVETGTNKKTAAYCTSLGNQAIDQAKETYNCNVTGVVTDNEKKMEVMRDNLKKENPGMVVYGCSAHWLNLLGQDITPVQIINQIVEVNK